MGMFDYLVCDLPLPTPLEEEDRRQWGGWQTKSLDCTLSTYHLRADGTLWKSDDFINFTGDLHFGLSGSYYKAEMVRGRVTALSQEVGGEYRPIPLSWGNDDDPVCPVCNGTGHLR